MSYLMSPDLCHIIFFIFFFNDTATTEIYTLSLHDALPISLIVAVIATGGLIPDQPKGYIQRVGLGVLRSEEHTSELQSHSDLVCRLLLEKKKKFNGNIFYLMIQITNYYITACCE